uniref:NADH-ubiquinone oxidoreductase chain 5 n=1 Tax=Pachyneuron aphidis TaxID=909094 RepID=A0A6G6D9Y1_9HYME|nr:NADH dehydrogenase subunit 5 [Pachyneuron aphidis]
MMLYYLSGLMFLMLSFMFFLVSLIFLLFKINIFLEWNIINLNSMNLNMFIYLDWISLLFIFTVMLISSMIMFYCNEYMNHELFNIRFFYLMLLFIFSMMLMIISPNMVSIIIGWDGLGLVSYCLIIYYQNYSSFNSGMLTVLLNRIGDVMIMLSISMMFIYGSWNFMLMNKSINLIILLITIASFTKSAQFPFSSWLPAAMAAPTPVSSLVHSSTLVTAGVYLMIRFNYLIYLNDKLLFYIMLTGLLTMMFAGFSANFIYDFKKIIAFSTLSQLGLMMMIFGMKNWELSFYHLIIHAMFKSMMFMCSGVVIHNMLNYQDIRYMGKLKEFLPITMMFFFISNLSLCGMPFMSGFFSKDLILENMFMMNMNMLIYLFMLISTGLTVSYTIRLIMYLMMNKYNFISFYKIYDCKMMNYPMIILMIMTIFFGNFMNYLIFSMIELIYLLPIEKILILILCFLFLILSKFIYFINMKFNYLYFFKNFMGKMWFLYEFIPIIIIYPLNYSKMYLKLYDKGWSEMFMKNLVNNYMNKLNKFKINKNNNLMNLMFIIVYIIIIMNFM